MFLQFAFLFLSKDIILIFTKQRKTIYEAKFILDSYIESTPQFRCDFYFNLFVCTFLKSKKRVRIPDGIVIITYAQIPVGKP